MCSSDLERALSPEIRRQRDEIEMEIAQLRDEKEQMSETEYYQELEELLLELADLYK